MAQQLSRGQANRRERHNKRAVRSGVLNGVRTKTIPNEDQLPYVIAQSP
jgi:predicted hotdog family 3-hydroxylacyl-ACP dehydratase